MVDKIKTGIPGFDELIQGGIPEGHLMLISGTPGTGKSIFCSQILYNNALKGKKCLYLNLEQNEGRLENQMIQFGWNPKKVEKNLKVVSIDTSDPAIVEFILNEIQKTNYDLIALDSLDTISSSPMPEGEFGKLGMEKVVSTVFPTVMDPTTVARLKLKRIFTAIAKAKATAFFTSEKVENGIGITRDTISEFLCDGIVLLHAVEGEEGFRTLNIPKMRLTKQRAGIYSFNIGKNGVEVKSQDE
jgi:circadian clock protein KaiC